MTWEKPTLFLRLNRPHRLQRIFSNGVGLFCFYQSIFTLQGGSYGILYYCCFFSVYRRDCHRGVINLMEGYGGDNPASKSQGVKQLMAGGGVILLGLKVVPLLSGLLG